MPSNPSSSLGMTSRASGTRFRISRSRSCGVAAVQQGLHDLLGLVQGRHVERRDQKGLVHLVQRAGDERVQAAPQVDQRPVVLEPDEAEHRAHVLLAHRLALRPAATGARMIWSPGMPLETSALQ